MEIIDFLDRGAGLGREVACFVMGDRVWSYGYAQQKTFSVAKALKRDNIPEGTKVAVLSPNHPDAFLCALGAIRAHMVWLPINPRYTTKEIIELLAAFDCEVLFIHSSFESTLAQLSAELQGLRAVICIDRAIGEFQSLENWCAAAGTPPTTVAADPEDVAVIMATGGTTGRPKGVMQTHRGFETYVANHMSTMWHEGRPQYLCAAPMTHAAGFMCMPMLARGGTIFVIDGAAPRLVADTIIQHKITDLFLPPTVIYMMLADPEIRSMKFPSLRYLLYGSAPMSTERLREALELFGPVMVQGYGQVEALMLCTIQLPGDHYEQNRMAGRERLSSCGRPVPFANVAVMDDDGNLLAAEKIGEIVVRSRNVMKGYYKNPEETAFVGRHGWHHTGDVGFRDRDGYYHLIDRAKDMIISGGFNIYPSEIEQVLWLHPGVQDCAVIGVPDDKWGEAVTAVVERKAGADVTETDLIALCRQHISPIKVPKRVVFWNALPRSSVGKVLKREIRNTFWQGAARNI